MKVTVKDIRAKKVIRDWLEPIDYINEIFEKEPHNSIRISEPFKVHMELDSIGEDIEVKGSFDLDMSFACDRCLGDGSYHFNEKLHYILVPKKEEGSEEIMEDEEEELSYFEGEEIDLSEIVFEHLMLSIPYKLLCSNSCKGLCPRCGANLNTEKCSCGDIREDNELAKKLKILKKE